MMAALYVVLLGLAAVCFLAAAANVGARVNLVAAGLLLWVAVPLIQHAVAMP